MLVEPGDADALADAIGDLLADPEAGARLGRAARERARHFPPQRTIEGHLAVYRAAARVA